MSDFVNPNDVVPISAVMKEEPASTGYPDEADDLSTSFQSHCRTSNNLSNNRMSFSTGLSSSGLQRSGFLGKREADGGCSPALKRKYMLSNKMASSSRSFLTSSSVLNNQSSLNLRTNVPSTSGLSRSSTLRNNSSNQVVK